MEIFPDTDHELARKLTPARRRRKRIAVFLIVLDPFLDDFAKLLINLGFILAMNAAQHEPGTGADIALVFLGPFDDFQILIAGFLFPISFNAKANAYSTMMILCYQE